MMDTKTHLERAIGKLTRLKTALSAFRPAAKVFGQGRRPQSGSAAERDTNRMDQPQAASRALEPRVAGGPVGYSTFAWPRTHAHFDTRTTMETSAWALSLDRANSIYNIALVALVIGGLVSIVAAMMLIWAADVRNRFTNAHLANVMAESDQAKAEAARASERMAELLLQTQQTRLEQEKLRLQHEQMRSPDAWRQVSPEQHDKIVKAMRGYSLTVNVLSSGNDPEAAEFAKDLVRTLKDGGAAVNAAAGMFPIPIRGLGMTLTKSDAGTALYMGLRGAGFEMKDLPERDPIMIVVGSKPPAF